MVLLVEAAGIPAIFLGLFGAIYGLEKERPWLKIVSYVAAAIGVAASVADRGVPNSLAQLMELGSVVGFVVGTCLLARERISGYFWYLSMNASMGWLMFEQGYPCSGGSRSSRSPSLSTPSGQGCADTRTPPPRPCSHCDRGRTTFNTLQWRAWLMPNR